MIPDDVRERAAEILRQRASRQLGLRDLRGRLLATQFDRQLAFIQDPAAEKAALCTRRAGKTSMWPVYCTDDALRRPEALVRIWGITRLRAKQLLWEPFKEVIRKHSIPTRGEPNETELSIKFESGGEIRLVGADKDKEVQKKRGDRTTMEVVLEAQSFGPYLKTLVDDVAGPSLFDFKGTMCLEGTPGIICSGYWWDVTGGDPSASRWMSRGDVAGWSCHRWSLLDNPYMPQWAGKPNWRALAAQEMAALKAKRRWTDDNPTWQREYLGRWVNDLGVLFYAFDPTRNLYDPASVVPAGPGWTHVLGWDLGFRDDMALVVWGWHENLPDLYEAASWKKPGALDSEVMAQIAEYDGRFNIIRSWADTGGGGRMYVESVTSRYGRTFEPAKKTEKYEHVRLFNDDLRTGHVKLIPGSPLAIELANLPRDLDWPPPEKPEAAPREDPRFPNHCADAALYSYRGAQHFWHRAPDAKPHAGSQAWADAEARRMQEAVLERVRKKHDPWDLAGSVDAEWWDDA